MHYKTLNRPLQIKAVDESGRFTGYGSVFGNVDLHKDVILPGAFAESLDSHRKNGTLPSMLWQHKMADVVGIYDDMKEDEHGLFLSGELFINDNVPEADKAYTLMRRKAVRGMSVGFNIPKGGETYNKDADVWEISKIDLVEVSIVTYPANPEAQIATVKAALDSPRDFERFLRDAGLSANRAKRLMSGGYSAMMQCDADDQGDIEALATLMKLFKP